MLLDKLIYFKNSLSLKLANNIHLYPFSLGLNRTSTFTFAKNSTQSLSFSTSQFHKTADDTLEEVYDSLDSLYGEHIESIDLSNGILTTIFKAMPKNPILISKNQDKSEIWYASHSGVDYFSLKPGDTLLDSWKSNTNDTLLSNKLKQDIKKIIQ